MIDAIIIAILAALCTVCVVLFICVHVYNKTVEETLDELNKCLDIPDKELDEEIGRFECGLEDEDDRDLRVMKFAMCIKMRYGKGENR